MNRESNSQLWCGTASRKSFTSRDAGLRTFQTVQTPDHTTQTNHVIFASQLVTINPFYANVVEVSRLGKGGDRECTKSFSS